MGDVAMIAPVLKALVSQYADIEILMLSRPFFKPIFQDISGVKFISADIDKQYKGLVGLYRLFKELKKYKIDYVVDLHDVLRTKFLRNLFKINAYKVGKINKGRNEKKALIRTNNKVFIPLKNTHQRYADVFELFNLPIDLKKNFTTEKKQVSKEVGLFLQLFKGQKLLGIAPFAQHEGKQYPIDKIKQVIQNILSKKENISILLFGGGMKEKQLLETLVLNKNKVFNLAGIFSLSQELEIISRLNLMLSMDSANAHLAAIKNIPVITIWGATHPYAGFAAFGQNEKNNILPDLKKFPQLPTSIYGNKVFANFENVWKTIPPEKVVEKILNNIL